MGKNKDFLRADFKAEATRWGRIEQAMRELAVVLRRDIAARDLAVLLELDASTLTGWKQGSRPTEASMERLERLFLEAGLPKYTARYFDYGDDAPREAKPTGSTKVGRGGKQSNRKVG